MNKNISFIVCINGLGHFKRVLATIEKLKQTAPSLTIHVFCSESQKLKKNYFTDKIPDDVQFHTGIMKHAPDWLATSYSAEQYKEWCSQLSTEPSLNKSHLIISDNYVAPLSLFEQTILMGSFVWHDVLTYIKPDLHDLLVREKELFRSKKPAVICLKDFAMNEIKQYSKPFFVGLFKERVKNNATNKKNYIKKILITGGGTANFNSFFIDLSKKLAEDPTLELYCDSHLSEPLINVAKKFEFTEAGFSSLDLIVARPGIGIITDAITNEIPLACAYETGNAELAFNAERISYLKAGINLIGLNPSASAEKIQHLSANELGTMKAGTSSVLCGGASDASNYILSKLT